MLESSVQICWYLVNIKISNTLTCKVLTNHDASLILTYVLSAGTAERDLGLCPIRAMQKHAIPQHAELIQFPPDCLETNFIL